MSDGYLSEIPIKHLTLDSGLQIDVVEIKTQTSELKWLPRIGGQAVLISEFLQGRSMISNPPIVIELGTHCFRQGEETAVQTASHQSVLRYRCQLFILCGTPLELGTHRISP